MSDLEDIVAKARAVIGRKIKTADMLRILDEREAIIKQLLKKIDHLCVDNCALAVEVWTERNMQHKLAQKAAGTA